MEFFGLEPQYFEVESSPFASPTLTNISEEEMNSFLGELPLFDESDPMSSLSASPQINDQLITPQTTPLDAFLPSPEEVLLESFFPMGASGSLSTSSDQFFLPMGALGSLSVTQSKPTLSTPSDVLYASEVLKNVQQMFPNLEPSLLRQQMAKALELGITGKTPKASVGTASRPTKRATVPTAAVYPTEKSASASNVGRKRKSRPTDPDSIMDEVIEKRRRNTEAARRSRQRKVQRLSELEARIAELEDEVDTMHGERARWNAKETDYKAVTERLQSQIRTLGGTPEASVYGSEDGEGEEEEEEFLEQPFIKSEEPILIR